MSLGLLLLGHHALKDLVDQAKVAEACGYDEVWLADERFYREVYSCLTHFAANTSRVRLGPCVTDPYARHPALTASAIATLDEISDQRAMLAIGAGISGFAELGIVRNKPARAIREAVQVIRPLLRGETVDFHGEVVNFNQGKLSFTPVRANIPIYVASNGPLGHQAAGAVADGAIMEACASVEEVRTFRADVDRGAIKAGRDPKEIKLIARLNTCVGLDGRSARDAVRPTVARLLGAGRLKLATLEAQGLTLPPEAVASVAGAAYSAGFAPYLHLLPLVTDRHVDACTLAGTVEEVTAHAVELRKAGVDSFITMPFGPVGGTPQDTIRSFGEEVWPAVKSAMGE
jgi:5,10-methylenetetrahydromethanopterin reductase